MSPATKPAPASRAVRSSAQKSQEPAGVRAPFVDDYITKAAPFAHPILTHLRALLHKAVPGLEETKKWSMPFFMYKGIILGNMAAFKQHCSLGLWGGEIALEMRGDGMVSDGAMGSFGRVTSLAELPSDKELITLFKKAAAAIDTGQRTRSLDRPTRKAAKPEIEVPPELAAELKKNKGAQKVFDAFAPSCRKEYIDWIAGAKREETRLKRVAEAVGWIAEGKRRNWKYENC
jgi:uncharacterized protein YdeI (YjbR/CyaY-like superfamily)